MNALIRDERGQFILPLVALIIAPIVVLMLAGSVISAIRTGAGVTEALTRNAHSQVIFTDFTKTVESATTITVDSVDRITATADPALVPAAAAGTGARDFCTSTTWELTGDGLRTLTQTTRSHQGDCASPVSSERTEELTGLAPGAAFTFENLAGRPLTLTGGTLAPGAGTAPTGVSAEQWASTRVGAVILTGTMQEMFSDRYVEITAVNTPARQP